MAILSAKNGVGTWETVELTDVTDIQINESADAKVYASSSTAGEKSRVAGHSDIEGSFTVKDDTLPGTMTIGAIGTLKLESVTGTTLYTGEAMITDFSYSVPIESGDIVETQVLWGDTPTSTP